MDSKRDKLIQEIGELISDLDMESLNFLRDQSSVLAYNKKVRERNEQTEEEDKILRKKSEKSKKSSSKKIETRPGVYIEQLKNKKFFNICIQNEKLFMDYKEIIDILKIATASDSEQTGASRLYQWFKKERKDVLVDGHIGSPSHPALKMIYRELLDKFSLD